LSQCKVSDISALQAAVAEHGATIKSNVRPRMYFSDQHGVCDYVITHPNSKYDIGLEKDKDGNYDFVFDPWEGHLFKVFGDSRGGKVSHIAKIVQSYNKHAMINAAIAKGYTVTNCLTESDGTVNLVLGNIG
jgi:hypothetical protein